MTRNRPTTDRGATDSLTSEVLATDGHPSTHAGPDRLTSDHARPDRLTTAAGWSLLTIAALHTLVFAFHPYWDDWFAGPTRTGALPLEAVVQFWGLPGGFVVPGILLALLTVRLGRRGETLPAYAGWGLGLWAASCLWIVGPSGFLLVLVPSALLITAHARARRRNLGAEPRLPAAG